MRAYVASSFLRRTIESAASLRVSATLSADVTLVSCVLLLILSKAPTLKKGVRIRNAPSSTRSAETAPLSIAAAMAWLFMCEALGISWSSRYAYGDGMHMQAEQVCICRYAPSSPDRDPRR